MAKHDSREAGPKRSRRKQPDPEFAVADVVVREDFFHLRLESGVGLEIPMALIPEVDRSAPESSRVRCRGSAVEWPDLDVFLDLAGLVVDSLGPEIIGRDIAKRNGSRTSPAKAASSAANGKKGGRPPRPKH